MEIKKKTYIIIILLVGVLLIGGLILLKGNMQIKELVLGIINEKKSTALTEQVSGNNVSKDGELTDKEKVSSKEYRNYLRITNLNRSSINTTSGNFLKSYIPSEKTIIIENESLDKILEVRLDTPYIVDSLIASNSTKVAEMTLKEFTELQLFDRILFYDVKDNYKEVNRSYQFKYGVEELYCQDRCVDYTTWVPFNNLSELPKQKNIRIGLFVDTSILEKIEWVPVFKDIKLFEFAEYQISTMSYAGGKDFTSPAPDLWGFDWSADGTKLYIADKSSDFVYQENCTLPYNVTSCSNTQDKLDITLDTALTSVQFKGDGTKMYVLGQSTTKVYQYSLSTAWNVSTGTYDTKSCSIVKFRSMKMRDDGKVFWTVGEAPGIVEQYNLSTAWDVSTCSNSADDYDVANGIGEYPYTIEMTPDRTKMFVGKVDGNFTVYELDITNENISNPSYTSGNRKTSHTSSPFGETRFNNDGTMFYLSYYISDIIEQYTIEPAASTCTCAGVDTNWVVDLSEYCFISDACNLGTGKLSFTGSGNFTCNANINTTNLGDVGSGNTLWIYNGCDMQIV